MKRKGISARSLGNHRRHIVARLYRRLEPHMYDSGYRKALDPTKGILGGTRPLRLWAPPDKPSGALQNLGGFVLHEIYAVTKDGVMTDAYGGGAVTTPWQEIPVEDLLRLERSLGTWLPVTEATRMPSAHAQ